MGGVGESHKIKVSFNMAADKQRPAFLLCLQSTSLFITVAGDTWTLRRAGAGAPLPTEKF